MLSIIKNMIDYLNLHFPIIFHSKLSVLISVIVLYLAWTVVVFAIDRLNGKSNSSKARA